MSLANIWGNEILLCLSLCIVIQHFFFYLKMYKVLRQRVKNSGKKWVGEKEKRQKLMWERMRINMHEEDALNLPEAL